MKIRSLAVPAIVLFSAVFLSSFIPQKVTALASPLTQIAECRTSAFAFFGFPSWDSCLPLVGGKPAITKLNDIWLIAFPLVETMVRAAGYLAVGFIIWGGVKYIRSQGNASEITGAKTTILNAIIGLVVSVLAVMVVRFIADRF